MLKCPANECWALVQLHSKDKATATEYPDISKGGFIPNDNVPVKEMKHISHNAQKSHHVDPDHTEFEPERILSYYLSEGLFLQGMLNRAPSQ